ncbi:hypothetical protein [Paraburkholderia sp. MM5384-R2]|uniref:hypothetical protein n=1 Tax=Paraburkholderia sp. MM5384-R2 TaxID=2723097 RepID=UPI0018137226|nr:hypothetical protein [Paraburkholderia sp. MM5384-R2]MBB5501247.1 hypothetical protein [Paraburkholderia sp. MM5384-R2]
MPNKKRHRSLLQPSAAAHSKARLLPMPRKEASDLVLRARIALERLRNGEADRPLINLVSQVTLIVRFVVQAGHGKLDIEVLEAVKRGLEDALAEADNTGIWNVSETLIDGLIDVINEYDRQICVTRMEILVRASDHLDRLSYQAAARDTRAANSHVQLAR